MKEKNVRITVSLVSSCLSMPYPGFSITTPRLKIVLITMIPSLVMTTVEYPSCESEKLDYLKTLAKTESSNRVVDWALFKCSAASTGLQKLENIKQLLQLIYKQSMFKDFGSGR